MLKQKTPILPVQNLKQAATCPHCMRNFSKAGLVGHMYHVHGVGQLEYNKPSAVGQLGMRVIELTEQLRVLRAKRKEAEALKENKGLFGTEDKTVKELLAAYDATERRICDELRVLSGRRSEADLVAARAVVEAAEREA